MFCTQKISNARQWDPASLRGNGAANKKWERQDCVAGKTLSPLSHYCQLYWLHKYFTSWMFNQYLFYPCTKDHERFLTRCQEMELQLSGKENEMEQLFQKQRRVSSLETIPTSFLYVSASLHFNYIDSQNMTATGRQASYCRSCPKLVFCLFSKMKLMQICFESSRWEEVIRAVITVQVLL